MSHVAHIAVEAGKPLITDLRAVHMAAANLGLECVEQAHYRTWADDHDGQLVGDYPSRPNAGNDAVLVLRIPAEKAKEIPAANYGTQPYEIGVVPDPDNPGCYTLASDYFCNGYGMFTKEAAGETIFKKDVRGRNTNQVEVLAPRFMQHYHMCCDALAAQAAGDEIRFAEQPDGSWVAEINTEARLGV